ncbi:hypothetical protein Bca4012_010986 [Brassica carinata]
MHSYIYLCDQDIVKIHRLVSTDTRLEKVLTPRILRSPVYFGHGRKDVHLCSPFKSGLVHTTSLQIIGRSQSHGFLTELVVHCSLFSWGDNVNKRDDIPVDRMVLAKVETGGSSQQAAPDAVAAPNGEEPPKLSVRAASKMAKKACLA